MSSLPFPPYSFHVRCDDGLLEEESRFLEAYEGRRGDGKLLDAELSVEGRALDEPFDESFPSAGEPARVSFAPGTIEIEHATFRATLSTKRRIAALTRMRLPSQALRIVVRAAYCSWSVESGVLPLHAALVDVGPGTIAFFGVSGAGKTTLARTSRHAVLTDEMAAVYFRDEVLAAGSGFWGDMDEVVHPHERRKLLATIELGRGPKLKLERLPATESLRRLLPATLVPLHSELWPGTIAACWRIAASVPCFRLERELHEDPWPAILDRVSGH